MVVQGTALTRLTSRLTAWPVKRVMAVASALTIIPLLVLSVITLGIATRNVKEEVLARAQTTASVSAVEARNEMGGLGDLVESIADRPSLERRLSSGAAGPDPLATGQHLEKLQQIRPDLVTTFITDASGKVVDLRPVSPQLIGSDASFRDWFKGVSSTRATYVSSAVESPVTGKPKVVAVATPITSAIPGQEPRLVGYLGATIGLGQWE